jgi:hypothetical protein
MITDNEWKLVYRADLSRASGIPVYEAADEVTTNNGLLHELALEMKRYSRQIRDEFQNHERRVADIHEHYQSQVAGISQKAVDAGLADTAGDWPELEWLYAKQSEIDAD